MKVNAGEYGCQEKSLDVSKKNNPLLCRVAKGYSEWKIYMNGGIILGGATLISKLLKIIFSCFYFGNILLQIACIINGIGTTTLPSYKLIKKLVVKPENMVV